MNSKFLSGKKFFIEFAGSENGRFRYVADPDPAKMGHIEEYCFYHCNVSKITKLGFYWFAFVMNKKVSGYIKFSELKF